MRVAYIILLFAAVVSAIPANPVKNGANKESRIVGGQVTTIDRYPYMVAMLSLRTNNEFRHDCGGSIINSRTILSAAHCFYFMFNPSMWRMRVGSTYAHSGGVVHTISEIIMHPEYIPVTTYIDIALARVNFFFQWSPTVQSISIAGPNYNVADNQVVWAAGWGATDAMIGLKPEELHDVQIYTVNQEICNQRYRGIINWSMLCAGILDIGGRDQCGGDSGGPLLHNNVVVGVTSFGNSCADPRYPGVNARVSYVSGWIVDHS